MKVRKVVSYTSSQETVWLGATEYRRQYHLQVFLLYFKFN
ncbi:unnamed protein product [Brugia timori]|uniref:Uncharacterized protein n=1 Tax=Brugia timori TaxID=42155 RepID=A0A0R3R6E2_9BILA|nr:unnamed protein product [Brugia timori]